MNYNLDKYTIVEKDAFESNEDFHKEIKKQALLSPHYQHLSKRIYRKINGCVAPIKIFKDIAIYLYATEMGVLNIGYSLQLPPKQVLDEYYATDIVSVAAFAYSYDWAYNNYSMYCLDKNLAHAFLNSSPPKQVVEIKPFATGGILMLPQGLIKNPDGNEVNFIIFKLVKKGEIIKSYLLNQEIYSQPFLESDNIAACFYADRFTYITCFPIQKNEGKSPTEKITKIGFGLPSIEEASNTETELSFTNKVRDLLLQVFLYQQLDKPRLEVEKVVHASKHNAQFNSNKPLTPILIGKDYKIKRIQEKQNNDRIGTHASPKMHMRSGHWREQPIGNRILPEYKTIWIEPTIINNIY